LSLALTTVEEEQGLLSSDGTPQNLADSLHKEDHKHVGMVQVFQDPGHRKAVLVVIMVMVAQQLTGTLAVLTLCFASNSPCRD
jgi:hypothetical protein